MSMMSIRTRTPRDREAIRLVEEHAFGQKAEAGLVDALVAERRCGAGAGRRGGWPGRRPYPVLAALRRSSGDRAFPAVALAPLAVEPSFHGTGIGGALVREAHRAAEAAGEKLSIVRRRSGLLRPLRLCARARAEVSRATISARRCRRWPGARRRESGRLVYARGLRRRARSLTVAAHAALPPRHRI